LNAGTCNRCKMICIDQKTGTIGKEPLLTLSKFRREKGKILFGIHLSHIRNESEMENPIIKVGEILKLFNE